MTHGLAATCTASKKRGTMEFGDWEINLKGNIFDKTDRDFFVTILEVAHRWGFNKYVNSIGVAPTPGWADDTLAKKKAAYVAGEKKG